eukprot:TRINITY_DN2289_c0_g1_i1.p1 TRINITY_DN2289_c0_g1~~TRINITY_DN2289_c0_g1_i1.p1  ORF type:complete len:331 (-),score=34.96 TRINITY_DN2289_c0_g1_i1:158-1150(-)
MNDANYETFKANMVSCRLCGRKFSDQSRLAIHNRSCTRSHPAKPVGVVAAVSKPAASCSPQKRTSSLPALVSPSSGTRGPPARSAARGKPKPLPKWKQQSLELRAALKAMRAHARGLPPPPMPAALANAPKNDGYVQCPHCTRRFGPDSAQRHIAACKNTINKPKPPPKAPTLSATQVEFRTRNEGYPMQQETAAVMSRTSSISPAPRSAVAAPWATESISIVPVAVPRGPTQQRSPRGIVQVPSGARTPVPLQQSPSGRSQLAQQQPLAHIPPQSHSSPLSQKQPPQPAVARQQQLPGGRPSEQSPTQQQQVQPSPARYAQQYKKTSLW